MMAATCSAVSLVIVAMASGSSIVLTLSDVIIPTGLANSKCRPFFIFTPLQAIMQTDAVEQQEQIAALRDFAATGLAELERLLAQENQAQIAVLENFAAGLDLAGLEPLLAGEKAGQIVALERFATASDLETLRELAEEQRTKFDAIDFLRLSNAEEFHSNFLAWLLNPQQNHGLGGYFLKTFLYQTCTAASKLGISAITPSRIHATDWSPTEVRREWQYIDILILNRDARFVCAVENKIRAAEGIDADGTSQLTRYRETLEREFPDFTKHYVFLSPNGVRPYREEEQKYWMPANYATILELVERTIDDTEVREDVRAFLQQYATTLRRKIVPDSNTNIQQLARQIYLNHREAIELIYRHKPNYASEIKQILKEAISRQANWKLDKEETNWVRFRPCSWVNSEVMDTGKDWLPQSKALILCQLHCADNHVNFYITLGSGSNRLIREKIIDSVNQNPSLFNQTGRTWSDGFMTFHHQAGILDDSDLNNWDDCDAVGPAKLRAWVADFTQNKFPAMNDVIVKCLEEYEAEQA